jgi:PDZ domain
MGYTSNDGYRIVKINPKSAAAKAGLNVEDIVTRINDRPMKYYTLAQIGEMLSSVAKKKTVTVYTYTAKGEIKTFTLRNDADIPASSSSSASSGPIVPDTLPYIEPRPGFIVLSQVSPVVSVCRQGSSPILYSSDSKLFNLTSILYYNLETKAFLGSATKTADGKWKGPTSKGPYYMRWKIRPLADGENVSQPDFSSRNRIEVAKNCDGTQGTGGFYIVPAGLTDVRGAGSERETMTARNQAAIGSFAFTAAKSRTDQQVHLKSLKVLSVQSAKTKLSNVKLVTKINGAEQKIECLLNQAPFIICDLPEYMSEINKETVFTFYADVVNMGGAGTLQLQITDFGSPTRQGSVTWTNTYETFNWMGGMQEPVKSTLYELK